MKSAAQPKKQPNKGSERASRDATPVHRAEKPTPPARDEAPRTAPPAVNGSSPMSDLTPFGVDQHDAQAHVGQCELCGRAYRHVMKNPKDAMALQSFGRNIAVCLAGKQATAPA